jgi:hypothetical protein
MTPFRQGFQDFRDGKPLDDSPFGGDAHAFSDYKNGWQMAKIMPTKTLAEIIFDGPKLNDHEIELFEMIIHSIEERSRGNKDLEKLLRYALQDLADNC